LLVVELAMRTSHRTSQAAVVAFVVPS